MERTGGRTVGAYEDPGAADEEARAALAAVGAGAWVRGLPEGPGTRSGEGGVPADGSQAQRLAPARVVPAEPHTLVPEFVA
ncbi:hypothetical protein KBP30_13730 [Streptomyces sp. Go40/10]|uniref:hypothetical protein n=1 Tax=Streptomyces sp. Go40/10 TaxID=2825844 RepID=UPI001E4BA201|nr:hypothetical protein [Streptomyces sp. Go40/10]UFR07652.1 hypothetical protein KBP30_13730 [Streptomyces sp. Go40/10]